MIDTKASVSGANQVKKSLAASKISFASIKDSMIHARVNKLSYLSLSKQEQAKRTMAKANG